MSRPPPQPSPFKGKVDAAAPASKGRVVIALLLTPPALEPVSLADAKHFLRVEHDDDDDVIAALIAAARVHVEAQARRALIDRTWRLVRDVWPASGRLPVLPAPLREVTAIRVFDADGMPQLLDVGDFAIDTASAPAVLAFARGASPAPGKLAAGIEIDIIAGYGDEPDALPAPLRQASACWSRIGTRTAA